MRERKRILIVDDDEYALEMVTQYFARRDYEVIGVSDPKKALPVIFERRPDLVILDIMMPELDGWEICRRLREISDIPIIMLTAKTADEDKIRGLSIGADDFVTKPVNMDELFWRVERILARVEKRPALDRALRYDDGHLVVDLTTRRVWKDGKEIKLTPKEFGLLACLLKNRGKVLSPRQILRNVWGPPFEDDIHFVKVHIHRLRKKLEDDPSSPRYILTERGYGYYFPDEEPY